MSTSTVIETVEPATYVSGAVIVTEPVPVSTSPTTPWQALQVSTGPEKPEGAPPEYDIAKKGSAATRVIATTPPRRIKDALKGEIQTVGKNSARGLKYDSLSRCHKFPPTEFH